MDVVPLPAQSRSARLIAQSGLSDQEIAEHVNRGLLLPIYRPSLVGMWRRGELEPDATVTTRLERLPVSRPSSLPSLVRAS